MPDEISRIQSDLFHLMEEEIRKNCLDKAIELAIGCYSFRRARAPRRKKQRHAKLAET